MPEKLRTHKKVAEMRRGTQVKTRCGLTVPPSRARTRGKQIDCLRCSRA